MIYLNYQHTILTQSAQKLFNFQLNDYLFLLERLEFKSPLP